MLLEWSSDLADLLICALMVFYGILALKAGHRLARCWASSVRLGKFVWAVAFVVGLLYLYWPKHGAPGGLVAALLVLEACVAYPVFFFLWFSNDKIKRRVASWA